MVRGMEELNMEVLLLLLIPNIAVFLVLCPIPKKCPNFGFPYGWREEGGEGRGTGDLIGVFGSTIH
jgi:hypothetical protein